MAFLFIRVVACRACVPIGNIPSTRVAHVPIVVVLYNVGICWVDFSSSSLVWWDGTTSGRGWSELGRGIGLAGVLVLVGVVVASPPVSTSPWWLVWGYCCGRWWWHMRIEGHC